MRLSEAARTIAGLLDGRAVVIGGVCANILGVERFTRDVDFATSLSGSEVSDRLARVGVKATIKLGAPGEVLPWVVHGELGDVPFQILPASAVGVDLAHAQDIPEAGFAVASREDFIRSKCLAGGQLDLHDVACLVLGEPSLGAFAKREAQRHEVGAPLEAWLRDARLLERYRSR